jgi:hypothetical protein
MRLRNELVKIHILFLHVLKKNACSCSVKNIVKRMKRQATDWDKIRAKHMSNNELVSKIYKEL